MDRAETLFWLVAGAARGRKAALAREAIGSFLAYVPRLRRWIRVPPHGTTTHGMHRHRIHPCSGNAGGPRPPNPIDPVNRELAAWQRSRKSTSHVVPCGRKSATRSAVGLGRRLLTVLTADSYRSIRGSSPAMRPARQRNDDSRLASTG